MIKYSFLQNRFYKINFCKFIVEIRFNKAPRFNSKLEIYFNKKTKLNYMHSISRFCKVFSQRFLEKYDGAIYVTAMVNDFEINKKIINVDDVDIVLKALEFEICEKIDEKLIYEVV